MNGNNIAIERVLEWLNENEKSYQWLADEIGVSKSLMGHILNGTRQFLPERIVQVAKAIGTTPAQLMEPRYTEEKPYTLQLRGKADSRVAKRHIENMLFAIEDSLLIERANSIPKGEINDGCHE